MIKKKISADFKVLRLSCQNSFQSVCLWLLSLLHEFFQKSNIWHHTGLFNIRLVHDEHLDRFIEQIFVPLSKYSVHSIVFLKKERFTKHHHFKRNNVCKHMSKCTENSNKWKAKGIFINFFFKCLYKKGEVIYISKASMPSPMTKQKKALMACYLNGSEACRHLNQHQSQKGWERHNCHPTPLPSSCDLSLSSFPFSISFSPSSSHCLPPLLPFPPSYEVSLSWGIHRLFSFKDRIIFLLHRRIEVNYGKRDRLVEDGRGRVQNLCGGA